MEAGKLVAPKAIPKDVKIIKEEEQPPDMGAGISGGVPGGVAGGSMGGTGTTSLALRNPRSTR